MSRYVQKILIGGCSVLALYTASKQDFYKKDHLACEPLAPFHKNGNSTPKLHLPTRNAQLTALQSKEEYDILVIGGGATGAGVALDSISRGLKTALVELDDFSSGTSSRSTKLIHGGVRYLQKAILHLDIEQYRMVKEALHERTNLIKIAPHLSQPLPIMLPIYRLWQVPYYWIGIKAYDLVAWKQLIRPSYYVSRERALELFPTLKKDKLVGAIIYYDGQHNDARMNLSIIITAARMGAKVANHVAVTSLLKKRADDGKETVCGVKVKDMLTGLEWDVYAKAVINATGPFTDSIRKMDNEQCTAICQPSSGVHVVLPNYYSPANMGLLDPATSDGRVVFLLPWQNMTLAGTTDRPCSVTHQPSPAEDDILFILKELKNYLNPEISLSPWDVKSAWSGIRPLVVDPSKDSTESIARNHVLQISDSNLITIAGGKWTTYRIMAKDAVDAAVETCNLKPESGCQTDGLLLEGAKGWTPNMYIKLVQYYDFDTQVARHLANTYGDRAFAVAGQESLTGKELPRIGKRLHERFPYIEAEVRYAVTEYACTAVDVMARRLRIAFLDADAAVEVIPTVIEIMADVLKWDETRQNEEYKKARQFIDTEMRGGLDSQLSAFIPHIFTQEEIDFLTDRFYSVYTEKKGDMTFDDLKIALEAAHGENVDEDILDIILEELDISEPYQLKEYLLILTFLKSGIFWVFGFGKQERGPSDSSS